MSETTPLVDRAVKLSALRGTLKGLLSVYEQWPESLTLEIVVSEIKQAVQASEAKPWGSS